jgi:hypothetical protein
MYCHPTILNQIKSFFVCLYERVFRHGKDMKEEIVFKLIKRSIQTYFLFSSSVVYYIGKKSNKDLAQTAIGSKKNAPGRMYVSEGQNSGSATGAVVPVTGGCIRSRKISTSISIRFFSSFTFQDVISKGGNVPLDSFRLDQACPRQSNADKEKERRSNVVGWIKAGRSNKRGAYSTSLLFSFDVGGVVTKM